MLALFVPALGLALLYASAFYLPQIGSYWLPNIGIQILYPTAVGVAIITFAAAWFLKLVSEDRVSRFVGVLVLSALCWLAVVGAFSAAGYSALGVALVIEKSSATIETTRWLRVGIVMSGMVVLFVAVYAARRYWRKICRFLSILGFSYALLAVLRLSHYPAAALDFEGNRPVGPPSASSDSHHTSSGPIAPRQVVWIIMDELDYNETFGLPGGPAAAQMPNLAHFASLGVSAANAYSPAKDTVASIPALLSGHALGGLEFKNADLYLKTNSELRLFQQSDSIFGRLPEGPRSAAILGFYHPYCHLFPAVTPCEAWPEANVGRWFDALTFFGQPAMATARWLPDSVKFLSGTLFRTFEPMYRVTDNTMREFPQFLSLTDKSLIYVHVNLPHPPGDYAQRAERLSKVGEDAESYRRNLRLVDQLIGEALGTLNARPHVQDILLLVSADHWHRASSPLTPQRIPWVAWHVGETKGVAIDEQISTVHTADLVLAFLRGEIDTQEQIAQWWIGKPFRYPLMPNGYSYD
jgi:hypothetical protein